MKVKFKSKGAVVQCTWWICKNLAPTKINCKLYYIVIYEELNVHFHAHQFTLETLRVTGI